MGTSPITIGVGNGAQARGEPTTTAPRVTPPAQEQAPRARETEFVVCDQTIERLINRLKQFRRIATRYDKTDQSFSAMIHLAAAAMALK
jgi:transposase